MSKKYPPHEVMIDAIELAGHLLKNVLHKKSDDHDRIVAQNILGVLLNAVSKMELPDDARQQVIEKLQQLAESFPPSEGLLPHADIKSALNRI